MVDLILKYYPLKGADKGGKRIRPDIRINKYASLIASWGTNVAAELEDQNIGGLDIFEIALRIRSDIETAGITYNDLAKICIFIGTFGKEDLFHIWKSGADHDEVVRIITSKFGTTSNRLVILPWWTQKLKDCTGKNIAFCMFMFMGLKDKLKGETKYDF